MLSAIKEKRVYKEAKIKRKRHKRSVHEISMGVVPKDIHVSRREKKHFKNQRRLMRLVRLQIARITNYEAKLVQRTKKAYVERVAQKREKLLIRKKKTIALHKVSLFIAYYLLLHRSPNIHKTLQTPVLHTREIVLQQSKKISQPVDGVIKPNEANPESPWIILSIIYYLTMIREQGMTQYPVQPSAMIIGANKRPPQLAKHAYTSNMIKSLNLPKNGVIYRYFGTNDIV